MEQISEINLLNLLFTIGITILLVYGEPIKPIRDAIKERSDALGRLVNCSLCMGFWVGVPFAFMSGDPRWPFISSICAWGYDSLQTYFTKDG